MCIRDRDSDQEIASPLYATAVGLVMDGLKRQERQQKVSELNENDDTENINNDGTVVESNILTEDSKERKSFLDKLTERVKEFLDNAE